MPLAYGGMDFLVSASLSEGLPNAIGEAMACGVPCIATNVGDCATLIGDTGIVVPAGDVQALSRAILRMLALGPEQRILLGARARQRIIDEYSIAEMVSKTEALLLSLSGKDQWSEHNSLFS
jgi:glycosyltransferase involved in cell wall biosynthesis